MSDVCQSVPDGAIIIQKCECLVIIYMRKMSTWMRGEDSLENGVIPCKCLLISKQQTRHTR